MTKFYENSKFCTLFAIFKANKTFSGKLASVTFFYFCISIAVLFCAEFQKKLTNRFQEKLVTDVCTDERMDKHKFIESPFHGSNK